MYLALYRKYRPKTFEDVFGQDVIIQTLKNSITNNKINHAYIFSGPRGTGKTSIAKLFAKTINCEYLENGNPCNKCVSCTQINSKQNTDIIEIDAASNNGVDEIREIKNKINLVPSISKYKVYIIDEVHMLTTGAFNALLKTLEEPPEFVIFILATTDPHKIPATIISRCQCFDFKRISVEKIVCRLKFICDQEKFNYTEDALYEIARLSNGGMRDSISILDQVVAYSPDSITIEKIHDINGTVTQHDLKQFVDLIISREISEILKKINYYESCGKDFVKLTEELILFYKNILLGKVAKTYFSEQNLDEDLYLTDYENTKINYLINIIEKINFGLEEMKKNINPKLKLELLLINLTSMDEKQKVNNNSNFTITKNQNLLIEKENQNNIKKDKKEKTNICKTNKKIKKLLENVKSIRINNALAQFNKQKLIEFKSKLEDLKPFLLDPDYSELISMILDGNLKAASNNYLVFIYENESLSDLFNENILKIEKMIKQLLNFDCNVISTYMGEWNKIKIEFNSKQKKYNMIEEDYDLNEILSDNLSITDKNQIENLFEDIIEYN